MKTPLGTKIAVDYLNIYTLFFIVVYKYKVVHILYKHKYLNRIYESILKFLKKEIIYENLTYPSDNIYIIKKIQIEKELLINRNFIDNNLIRKYMYQKFYFDNIHSIVELKILLENKKLDRILINYPNYISCLTKKSSFYSKFKYYTLPSFVYINNRVHFWRNTYFYKNRFIIKSLIRVVSIIVNLRFSLKNYSQYDVLTYVKSKEHLKKSGEQSNYMNDLDWIKNSSLKCLKLDPLTLYLINENDKSHLFTLKPQELITYIGSLFEIFKTIFLKNNTHILMLPYIFDNIKKIYFINKIIKNQEVKIIYTCYEGGSFANILNIIGYTSKKTISMNTTWSLTYFPVFSGGAYKNCDIFFAWGDYHRYLYLDSGSVYRSIVTTGYLGGYAIPYMKAKTKKILKKYENKNYKLFAVYDNVVGDDGHITYIQLNDFYRGVLELLKRDDYACIIKSKKDTLYKYLNKDLLYDINIYSEKIIFQNEHADLGPALLADFVYAFSMNSLGSIASTFGKETFLYDGNKIVHENNKYLSKNVHIVCSSIDFIKKLDSYNNSIGYIDNYSGIDPFADENAQKRILEYVNLILISKSENKIDKIIEANDIYMLNYGQDKSFTNDKD